MAPVNEQYRSEYGWSMSLPSDWEALESTESAEALTIAPPVVFACSKDWSLSLTWMVASHPSDAKVVEAFLNASMLDGPISPNDAQSIVQRIWPALGEVTESEIIELPDGSRAIETLEQFRQESTGAPKQGYQLIFPVNNMPDTPAYFQRLCFYAPAASFFQHINDVRAAARTFHYDRPFGSN